MHTGRSNAPKDVSPYSDHHSYRLHVRIARCTYVQLQGSARAARLRRGTQVCARSARRMFIYPLRETAIAIIMCGVDWRAWLDARNYGAGSLAVVAQGC